MTFIDWVTLILWLLGFICIVLFMVFMNQSLAHYLRAQAQRIHGKEKDRIGYLDNLNFLFNESNYTEQGLWHRKKYFSYTGYAAAMIAALILIILVGMFYGITPV